MQASLNTSALYPNKWLAFLGIALITFAGYLDYTVVNVALPTIQQDLGANLSALQWIMNIYFLALCVLATIMGRLGDLFDRRRCFYIGAAIFGIASIIAGMAHHMPVLILGRFLQGVGGAMIFPLGPSLLPQSFPDNERGKAIAWLGSIGGIALALGPVLGGLIVTHWGWRWIFFINIPIILLGYLFCFKAIKKTQTLQQHTALDIKGMLLLAMTMCGLVLGLINSEQHGWLEPINLFYWIMALLAGYFLIQTERKHPYPLIDLKDFTNLLFFSGALLCFLAGLLSAVILFFDPLYLQIIQAQSVQFSGLVLFAIPCAVFLVSFLVVPLMARLGILNTILLGLGLSAMATLLHVFFNQATSLSYILLTFICFGSMWAMGNTVSIIAAQTAAGHERASVATGTIVTMFNIGGSLGLALAVVIYHLISDSSLQVVRLSQEKITILSKLIANPAQALNTPMDHAMQNLFHQLFLNGFKGVMIFLLSLCMMALIGMFVWKKSAK